MLLTYERWMALLRLLLSPRPPGPNRADSSHTIELSVKEATTHKLSRRILAIQPDICEFRPKSPIVKAVPESRPEVTTTLMSSDDPTALEPERAVSNDKEAVEAYTQSPSQFAGILMDISMPVMYGLEATRQIRAFEHKKQLARVTILTLTGLASDTTQQEALESGVDVFLTKPVRLKTLSEVLKSMNIVPLAELG
ncbi:hypothetical protein QQS21_011628 [Conoideocrella luteorostrata]|uniref:histidine kinase n=1 Tax=Conoideocrella luteorostrata TaxID=1105319 RepID=A0AAJ0CF35_9HYPO|nr:hypothetical protein QQS21_011628 [Conoideocrella luteorostrata]